MIAEKLAVKSSAAPRATASWRVPSPNPTTQSGGTSAIPTAAPAAVAPADVDVVSVTNAATRAQQTATSRSSAVGDTRARMGGVIS